jgi:hypothetical protein
MRVTSFQQPATVRQRRFTLTLWSQILQPLELDPLTVVDDPDFPARVRHAGLGIFAITPNRPPSYRPTTPSQAFIMQVNR